MIEPAELTVSERSGADLSSKSRITLNTTMSETRNEEEKKVTTRPKRPKKEKRDEMGDSMFERDDEAIFDDFDMISCIDSISDINDRDISNSSIDKISQSIRDLQGVIMNRTMTEPIQNNNFQMEEL